MTNSSQLHTQTHHSQYQKRLQVLHNAISMTEKKLRTLAPSNYLAFLCSSTFTKHSQTNYFHYSLQHPEADRHCCSTPDSQPHSHGDSRLWGPVYAFAFLRKRFTILNLQILYRLSEWKFPCIGPWNLYSCKVLPGDCVSVYPIIVFRNHCCATVMKEKLNVIRYKFY